MRPRCASLNLAPPLPKYIHTHVKCALSVSGPLECGSCGGCTLEGQLIYGQLKRRHLFPASMPSSTWWCVLAPVSLQQRIKCQDNEESPAQGLSQPAAVRPRSFTGQTLSQRTPGDVVHCLSFHLEEHILISPVGPAATEARWLWDESQQSCLIPLSGRGSFGITPPARVVLHLPSWRTRFRGLAQAQQKSSALPIPPLQSHPWGLIWSCQANPLVARCQWHCWDHSLE